MAKQKPEQTLILVAEDAELLREISSALNAHFKVLMTSDPHRALGWVQNDKSVGVLIVEQVLRSGLGIDVLQSAKELRPEVRRIMMTTYVDLRTLVEGLHNGSIHRMISKPLTRGELISLVPPASGQAVRAA